MADQTLHLHHSQLLSMCALGQYSLQQLVRYYASIAPLGGATALQPNNNHNPQSSLSQIFSNNKATVKKLTQR